MMDIEKLIEQLRSAAKLVAYYNSSYNGLYNLAADALEELQAELEQAKRERDAVLNNLDILRLQSGQQCFACDNLNAPEGDSRCNGCNYSEGHNYKWCVPKED